jgi:hypothetical protein
MLVFSTVRNFTNSVVTGGIRTSNVRGTRGTSGTYMIGNVLLGGTQGGIANGVTFSGIVPGGIGGARSTWLTGV